MKILLSPLSAIITTLLLTWLTIANPVLLQNVDLKFTDQLIVGEKQFIDDVVLVDISEETLNVHGQFPLPRDVYGEDDPRSSKEFSDGSWRLHSDCLTKKEQECLDSQ